MLHAKSHKTFQNYKSIIQMWFDYDDVILLKMCTSITFEHESDSHMRRVKFIFTRTLGNFWIRIFEIRNQSCFFGHVGKIDINRSLVIEVMMMIFWNLTWCEWSFFLLLAFNIFRTSLIFNEIIFTSSVTMFMSMIRKWSVF